MQASSTKPILAAKLVLTSTYQKIIYFFDSTAPSYLLPKLSCSSWLWPQKSELAALLIMA
jgi:hypothetical protein